MKNILKIVFVIIGTLIGAGFASGQEMYIFFFSYGLEGIAGLFVSNILMGIIIYVSLKIINKYKIKNYKEFLNIIIKINPKNKYFNIKNIINIIVNIFIIVTFFIMIAGFGAYFQQSIGINSLIGSIIISIILYIVFRIGTDGFVKVNEIITPLLIIFMLIIGILNLKDINFINIIPYSNNFNWLISSIIYSSYNSILLIPALIAINKYLNNKKEFKYVSIISTLIILILSIFLFLVLTRINGDIKNIQMPIVYVVNNIFPSLKNIYGIIVLSSIFTTAVSLGASFLQNITKNRKSYQQIAQIMCITGVAVSKLGFSNLVNLLYPIFGFFGIIQIIILFKNK